MSDTPVTCQLCNESFTKQGMSRHLSACIPKHLDALQQSKPQGRRKQRAFHLVVDGGGPFVLHLFGAATATLEGLDRALRNVWLECCGHLSAFTINDVMYSVSPMDAGWREERDMDYKLGHVLESGLTFEHEYDFGTTTYLELRVIDEYEIEAPRAPLMLLARNEMPELLCATCEERPAAYICAVCYGPEALLCETCAPEHECGEEMLLPFVNSPRTGQCGYTGPAEWSTPARSY